MSTKINGKAYGWSDVAVKLPSGDIEPQSIDYGDEMEKEAVYGRGNMPRGGSRGNYKASLKMSFLLDDFEQIEEHCKSEGVGIYNLNIPKIIVAYANDGAAPRIDEIQNIEITKVDNKAAQSDKTIPVEVECAVFGKVIRNGVAPV